MTTVSCGVVGAALLALALPADGVDEPSSPIPPPSAETAKFVLADETVIRPYLQAGVFVGAARDGGFAGDVGLRVNKVLASFACRLDIADAGYLTFFGGRAGYVLAENGWVALLAGVGAGGVNYHYNDAGTAKVAALTADFDLMFFPREWLLGPVTLGAEILAPFSRAPDPRNARLTPPAFLVRLSVHPLVLAKLLGR